ncbi:MAG: amidohydrolase family protein [Bifidobacteriaceae bacterium]|jgi:5-methylthioadenosine/S-adenosylhomocysteine deaminase|nr:amidohydrolase family protein [Bifidobacteriaceae bacterium]
MTTTLIRGKYVVSLDNPPVIVDGAVLVRDDRIEAVGPYEQFATTPVDLRLGDAHSIVMPGFINGHWHTECYTSAGMSGTIFEFTNLFLGAGPAEVDAESLELLATYGLMDCLKGGQTAMIDAYYGKTGMKHFGAPEVLRAYDKLGLRVAFALSLRDQNTLVHQDDQAFLAQFGAQVAAEVMASPLGYAWDIDSVLRAYRELGDEWEGRDGRFHFILAPDWTPACSDQLLVRAKREAAERGAGLTIHVLETRSELYWNLKVNGEPAVWRLDRLGILGDDVSLGHFVWATDADLDVFCQSGAIAVNNPGSNLRLSSGISRVADILDRGGRVCFGTDGISSTEREDFFAELRLALLLQRRPNTFTPHRLDSLTVLRAAGDNGARAIGWPDQLGRLSPGKLADLLVLEGGRVFFPPGRHTGMDPLDVILDRADHTDLRHVLVGGRPVLVNGRVTGVSEKAVLDRLVELGEEVLYGPYLERTRAVELAGLLAAKAEAMYEAWYAEPILQPAYVYNAAIGPVPPPARGA